jgi:PRC-barrel domain protein
MRNLNEVQTWRGVRMVDADSDKIGTIEDIFLDRHTGEPAWATVKTGLFGRKSSFVPLRDAKMTGGSEVQVPFEKEQVKDAPRIEADGELSADEERRLWEHYGRSDYGEWQGEDRTAALGLPDDRRGRVEPSGETGVDERAPAIVGVRLRRVIVVVPTTAATRQDQPAAGRG